MIRRRHQQPSTKIGYERWLVSYSDLVTLLFAFFVVMYSVSHVNGEKYRVLSSTLSQAFAGKLPIDADAKQRLEALAQAADSTAADTVAIAKQLHASLLQQADAGAVTVRATDEWVEIDLDASVLFASASAEPSLQARQIFADVARVLAPLSDPVEVAGHTDNRPINTAKFASNWELSAARATSVVHLLAEGGVTPQRLAAVGYGEFRPVADNDTEPGRAQNRRVVLKIARAAQPLLGDASSSVIASPEPATQPVPTDAATPNSSSEPPATSTPEIAPVRLNHGGLLFSSDPELPGKGR